MNRFLIAAAALGLMTTTALAGPAGDKAKAHIDAIAKGDVAAIAATYADSTTLNWVGGPLDGTYVGADKLKDVWGKFTTAQGPLKATVTNVQESGNPKGDTVTANVVPASRRATGYAISIFLIHLFGDISSPILIGLLSQELGKPYFIASSVGQFFNSIGAAPIVVGKITTNLTVGMLAVVPMLLLGCFFFLLGSRHLPQDQEQARLESGHDSLAERVYH